VRAMGGIPIEETDFRAGEYIRRQSLGRPGLCALSYSLPSENAR
jgi:hypothetical protein